MTITALSRNFDGNPNIVTLVTTDDLAAITTTDYLITQEDAIEAIQNGIFEWTPSDLVLIYYATAQLGFFTHDAVNSTFDVLSVSGGLSDTLQSGQIFVGNSSNVATGVAMTGDIGINNTGVTAIQAGVIVNADINAAAAIAYSKLAALPSADILVGSAGNVATATAVTGDVVISNTGVTAISAGVIVNADINAGAAIAFSKLAALPSTDILVGSAGNVATAVALSGDATLSNAGALTIANSAINSNKTNKNLMQYFTGTISAAQFNGMYGAPVLLLAAPGANAILVLDQFQLVMTYGTANYAGGGAVAVQYDTTIHGAGTPASMILSAVEVTGAGASTVFTFIADSDTAKPFATSVTKGLYLSNVTGAFTTGDSNFAYHIWWREIPTV